jgi:hypothetical protein
MERNNINHTHKCETKNLRKTINKINLKHDKKKVLKIFMVTFQTCQIGLLSW